MSGSNGNDKVYVIVILMMIGCFVYWYQTRLDSHSECESCKRRRLRHQKKHQQQNQNQKSSLARKSSNLSNSNQKVKKTVRFKSNNEEIENDRKPSRTEKSDRVNIEKDEDTEISLDSLDSSDHSNLARAGSSYGAKNNIKKQPESKSGSKNKKDDSTKESDDESLDSIAM